MRTLRAAVIEATVQACREALNVPQDWQIRDVAQGFTAPQDKTQESE